MLFVDPFFLLIKQQQMPRERGLSQPGYRCRQVRGRACQNALGQHVSLVGHKISSLSSAMRYFVRPDTVRSGTDCNPSVR